MAGHSTSASASPSNGGSQGQHNDQDVMFAQMMIPHHRHAIEMAGLAATRASSAEVKQLAADNLLSSSSTTQDTNGRGRPAPPVLAGT
jgi:uncharacterized protein (DUF305 family)